MLLHGWLKTKSYRVVLSSLIALLPIFWGKLHTYQQQRVINFLNPDHESRGTGYHILQSKIAIGSGGLYGHGFLQTQAHLKFLPEHSTDFVFALIAEEFGFIGSCIILFLLLALAFRGTQLAYQANNIIAKLTIASLTFCIVLSAFINICMTIGLLPVVGIPCRFVMVAQILTTLITIGVISSAAKHEE